MKCGVMNNPFDDVRVRLVAIGALGALAVVNLFWLWSGVIAVGSTLMALYLAWKQVQHEFWRL